jgi:hypothetical protein
MLDWPDRRKDPHPNGIRNYTGGKHRESADRPPAAITGL